MVSCEKEDKYEELENLSNEIAEESEYLRKQIIDIRNIINMEGRITASDVLNRLTLLEEWTREDEDHIYGRLKELEKKIISIEKCLHNLIKNETIIQIGAKRLSESKPHECPVCKGMCQFKVFGEDRKENCPTCQGKGIVWG